jgi:hypothetical protein
MPEVAGDVLYDGGLKQGEHDSKKRIAFPILLPEGRSFAEQTGELHVVPTGTRDHPVYGEMEITSADIREFVQNFKDKVRRDIPITAGHDNGMSGELPAIGWFTQLYDRGVSGLYADVTWTDEGVRLLRENAFKYFSPEFYEVMKTRRAARRSTTYWWRSAHQQAVLQGARPGERGIRL